MKHLLMNEHDNTFDLTDSVLRVLGIIGFFTAVTFGFAVAGEMSSPSSIQPKLSLS